LKDYTGSKRKKKRNRNKIKEIMAYENSKGQSGPMDCPYV